MKKITLKSIFYHLIYFSLALILIKIIKAYFNNQLTWEYFRSHIFNDYLFILSGYLLGFIPISLIRVHNSKKR
ncbi:TPA: hypothetical protein QFF28_002471, partial [Enterococcus faecium]